MTFKQKVHYEYQRYLSQRIAELKAMIVNLTEDAQNDAKGSAGDKHETALSMMHIEQEKLNQKLKEVLEQQTILNSFNTEKLMIKVALGTLVITDKMLFYISTALPQITVDGKIIIALSPHSPLGKEMLGKSVSDFFTFNKNTFNIVKIE